MGGPDDTLRDNSIRLDRDCVAEHAIGRALASAEASRDEGRARGVYEFFSPDISGPNSSQLSPLKRSICSCSSGAKSVGLVLILVPGR